MARLLIVHHCPSPGTRAMLDAVVDGTAAEGIEGVTVEVADALAPSVEAVLAADGYLLGTPANLGYISGALKHWFDSIYNGALGLTARRPFGAFLHGHTDTGGAELAIDTITTGLEWRKAQPFVSVLGEVGEAELTACWELGAALAAGLTASD